MKNLLNWNNFVAVSENSNGSYDLEFQGDGVRMIIRNAEMYDRPLIDGVIQHPLKYWYEKQNVERAIEEADGFDIVRELDADNEADEVSEVNVFDELVEELSDIATDVNQIGANFEKRLDKIGLALQNHEENVTVGKVMLNKQDPKNDIALTAKQLAEIGEELLVSKQILGFQNHAIALVASPQEVDREHIMIHYNELYSLTEDIYSANQNIAKKLDLIAFLLLESTNRGEIDAFYSK